MFCNFVGVDVWMMFFGHTMKVILCCIEVDWLLGRLIRWLAGWLVGWLVGWLAGWPVGWLSSSSWFSIRLMRLFVDEVGAVQLTRFLTISGSIFVTIFAIYASLWSRPASY